VDQEHDTDIQASGKGRCLCRSDDNRVMYHRLVPLWLSC